MIASVGSMIFGSSRSSTRTSPGAYMTTPRIAAAPLRRLVAPRSRCGPRGPTTSSQPAGSARRESLSMGALTGHPSRASAAARTRPTLDDVDNRQEVREFLTTRRARITPDQVGLPTAGTRRVPGLRRSEVATARRAQRRVLRPARARPDRRRLRRRPRRARPGAAARRDRTRPPLRPRPRRRRHPHLGPPPPSYAEPRPPRDRACSGRSRRSPTASPSSATRTRTCSPPTPSAARSTRR